MNKKAATLILGGLWMLYPMAAHAYIGPGVGAGAFAAALGVIGSIFLGLFAIIYYPVKRMLKRRKAATTPAKPQTADEPSDGSKS